MPITSNLILKTSLPKPTGTGYSDVIKRLRAIDAALDSIMSKSNIEIKIKLDVIGKIPPIPKSGTRSPGGGGRGKGGGKDQEPEGKLRGPRGRKFPLNPRQPNPPLDLIDQISSATTTKTSFKGGKKKSTTTEVREYQNLEGDILHTAKEQISAKGNVVKLEEKSKDLSAIKNQRDEANLRIKKAQLELNRKEFKENEKALRRQGYIEDKNFADNEAAKRLVEGKDAERIRRKKFYKPDKVDPTILRTFEITDELGKKQIQAGQKKNQAELKARADADRAAKKSASDAKKAQDAADRAAAKAAADAAKAAAKAQKDADRLAKQSAAAAAKAQRDADRAAAKAQRDADKAARIAAKPAEDLAKAQDVFDRRRQRAEATNQKLIAKGYSLQEQKISDIEILKGSGVYGKLTKSTFSRQDPNDPNKFDVVSTSTQTGGKTLRSKANTQAIKEQNARAENARRTADIEHQAQTLLSQGYTRTADQLIRDSKGMQHSVQQFARVSGNALHGYSVEVARINTQTGTTTAKILTGAEAWRFLGDSVARSTVKVALWTAATSIVFGTIAAVKKATEAIAELEAGTVLLARVGAGLGSTWNERIKQAGELTDKIVQLSVATSTDAVEGQKAATVFLRTGQSQQEAVKSVTAALVASRIAELGVVDAANLLTAAQTQFNLSADQLLPTLDTLNELSNKYRVTTNDLLQAISRTGSVFEQQGGTLSQLAAIIAVTAQTTARSGAEIGNAIKTVESRLANAENADVLLTKTGIGFRNAAGEARALTDVLLDVQIAFYRMSKAEQDAVTISAAGVRQRNILLAQINGAVDIIIAESRALRGDQDEYSKYGSAISEAAQTAGTLEAQVKKLMASFISMATGAKGPVTAFLKAVVFALQKTLDFFTLFSGAPAKFAAFAALVATVNVAMHHLGLTTTALTARMTQLFAVLASGQLGAAARGMAQFAAVTASTLGPAVLLSIAIVGITQAMSAYADHAAKAALLLELQASGHDAAAAQAGKQREAIESLTNAIGKQIQAYNQLDKAGQTSQRDIVGKNIDKLLSELKASGITIPVNFDPKNRKQVAQLQVAAQLEANKQLYKEEANKEKQVRAERKARNQKEQELFTKREVYKAALGGNFRAKAELLRSGDIAGASMFNVGVEDQIKSLDAELNRFSEGTDEYSVRIRKLVEELVNLGDKANSARLGTSNAQAVFESLNNLSDLEESLKRTEKNSGQLKDIFASMGMPEIFANQKQIEQVTGDLEKMKKEMEFLNLQDLTQEGSEYFNKLRDSQNKAATSLRDLIAENEKFSGITIQKQIKEMSDYDSKLDIAKTALEVTKGRVNLDPEKYSQRNNDLFQQINERNRLVQQAQQNIAAANSSTDPNVIASNRATAQERLNEASQKELEIQTSIYEKERSIVEEKKKANDELQRSLGLLSEEDKARVLIQGDFFNKNKGKLSIEQQFVGSAENNKIAQEYFNNRLETSDQARARGSALQTGPFANLVNKEIQDLNVQQAELRRQARAGGGESGARQRFIADKDAASRLAGTGGFNQTADMTTPSSTMPDLNVNFSGLDLNPLVTKFEEVTIGRMNAMAAELIERLEAIERRYIAPPKKPTTAPAAGGQ